MKLIIHLINLLKNKHHMKHQPNNKNNNKYLLIIIPHDTIENIANNSIINCTGNDASVIKDIIDICSIVIYSFYEKQ